LFSVDLLTIYTHAGKHLLGSLLDGAKTGDLIICSELSRLGRSLFMIMSILNNLLLNGVKIWTIKDNYRLDDDIQAKILAFAFGLSAEIERGLISQRTKAEIQALLDAKVSKIEIFRRFGVCLKTITRFTKKIIKLPKKSEYGLKKIKKMLYF